MQAASCTGTSHKRRVESPRALPEIGGLSDRKVGVGFCKARVRSRKSLRLLPISMC